MVVVLLEVVNVDQGQAQTFACAQAAATGALQHVIEVATVGEAGQTIDMGQSLQCAPLLGHLDLIAYPHPHDCRANGFGDIVGCAQAQTIFFGSGIALAGDENDGNAGGSLIAAQLRQHLIAIHARHAHIQQNQHESVGFTVGRGKRPGAVLGQQHAVLLAQQLGQHGAVHPLIIHDENGGQILFEFFQHRPCITELGGRTGEMKPMPVVVPES